MGTGPVRDINGDTLTILGDWMHIVEDAVVVHNQFQENTINAYRIDDFSQTAEFLLSGLSYFARADRFRGSTIISLESDLLTFNPVNLEFSYLLPGRNREEEAYAHPLVGKQHLIIPIFERGSNRWEYYISQGTEATTHRLNAHLNGFFLPEYLPGPRAGNYLALETETIFGDRELHLFDDRTGMPVRLEERPVVARTGDVSVGMVANDTRIAYYAASLEGGREPAVVNIESLTHTKGTVFHDLNADGTRQPTEPSLPRFPLIAEGEDTYRVFTDPHGEFHQSLVTGQDYVLRPVLEDCWEVTTASTSYAIAGAGNNDQLDFGLRSVGTRSEVTATLSSEPLGCDSGVDFTIGLTNTGCVATAATTRLLLQNGVVFRSASLAPVAQTTEFVEWDTEELTSGQTTTISVRLTIPADLPGDRLRLSLLTDYGDAVDTFKYRRSVGCAELPVVLTNGPTRANEDFINPTAIDEDLVYTIHFENNKYDTTYAVRLTSPLPPELDLTTLRPLSASHSNQMTVDRGGQLEVFFPDILLPAGDRGFYSFTARVLPNVESETPVINQVAAYFDYAPADVSNRVINTILVDMVIGTQSLPETAYRLYPNPTAGILHVELREQLSFTVDVFDVAGRLLQTDRSVGNATVSLSELPRGSYLVRIVETENGRSVTRRVVRQ